MKRIAKLYYAGVLMVLCALFLLPAEATDVDPARKCQLTLLSECNGTVVTDVHYKLYRVAEVTGSVPEFTLTGDFVNSPVELNGLDQTQWAALAVTLEGEASSYTPLAEANSDASGKAVFSDLQTGLYLVSIEDRTQDGTLYSAVPFCACLPYREVITDEWEYEVTARPKFSPDEIPESVSCKVIKVWDDEGYESRRPDSVTVILKKDGVEISRVDLNKDNNWMYEWTNLTPDGKYTVQEVAVNGYTVSVERIRNVYTITNRIKKENPPSPKPPKPTPPSPNPPSPGPSPRKLPQTGQDWTTAGLLCGGGLALVALGIILRRKKRDE